MCFGTGGLGTCVSMALCRLGVKKIILIDYDVVDISNLNRQILFALEDVGQPKVEMAKKRLNQSHNIQSEIVTYNLNIVSQWAEVVRICQEHQVTALFNMIDYGDWFDVAAQSLAIKLQIPLIQGGTFAGSLTIDFASPIGKPCLLCLNEPSDPQNFIPQLTPDKILDLENLSFLPKNNNPIGQSNVYLCTTASMLMVAQFTQFLIGDPEIKIRNRNIFYTTTFESVPFDVEAVKGCKICNPENSQQPYKYKNFIQLTQQLIKAQTNVTLIQQLAILIDIYVEQDITAINLPIQHHIDLLLRKLVQLYRVKVI